jgi:hypothetical protein
MKIEAHGKILLFTLWALVVSFFLANIARAGDPFLETEKFYASNAGEGHWFGHAVAISGDIIVVCAPNGDSAYVISKDLDDTWETKTLPIPPTEPIQYNCSVAASGDTVVVGNPASKSAYVFRQDPNTREWLQEELPIPPAPGFGWSVAISGNTLVVGAPPLGSAYVFNRDGSTWTEAELPLTTENAANGSFFGTAVATDGDTVLVGAPSLSGSAFGSAHVFSRDGSTWTEVEPPLTTTNAAADSIFGGSVAIDGDTAVIGASPFLFPFTSPQNGSTPPGSAHVFMRDQDASWGEISALTLDVSAFGASVALSGKTVVVGAPFDEYQGEIIGSVYAYTYSEGSWSETEKQQLIASDGIDGDRFGWSVAIDGNQAAAGALFGDASGVVDSGAAYLYILASPNHPPIAKAEVSPDEVKEGESFTLIGSDSEDPDGDPLIFNWVQISGPEVDLDLNLVLAANDTTNPAVRELVAPELSDGCDTLVFQLTVTEDREGGLSSDPPAEVKIEVLPNNEIHAKLGGRHHRWLDLHKHSFYGHENDQVTIELKADPNGWHRGRKATLILKDKIKGARLFETNRGSLPNYISATLPADGTYTIYVVKQPWFWSWWRHERFEGDYILTLEGTCGKLNRTPRFSKQKCKTR